MKNLTKAIGIIAFIAVIVFTMVGCDLFGSKSIEGIWMTRTESKDSDWQIKISGSDATVYVVGNAANSTIQSAIDNGIQAVGSPWWRNIKSTGDLTWSAEGYYFNSNLERVWGGAFTLTMSEYGSTLRDGSNTWYRK